MDGSKYLPPLPFRRALSRRLKPIPVSRSCICITHATKTLCQDIGEWMPWYSCKADKIPQQCHILEICSDTKEELWKQRPENVSTRYEMENIYLLLRYMKQLSPWTVRPESAIISQIVANPSVPWHYSLASRKTLTCYSSIMIIYSNILK